MTRDRLFFFGDYQGSRQDAPGFGTASVAPEAWRRGDLSSIAAVIRDPQTGLPFPGNQIPTSRFGPIARALFADTAQLSAAQPRRVGRGRRQLRRRDAAQDPRPPGRRPGRLERLGQRQAVRALLVCHLRGQARRQSVRPGAADPQRPAVLERRRQLEPHFRPDHGQRAAGRVQPHHASSRRPTTGRASATPTRPTASPAASQSTGSASSTSPAPA